MIAGVLLAAGGSSRLGRPKQLLTLRDEPLVRRVARALLDGGCRPVVVVLGAHAERVTAALDGLKVERVHNDGWQRGMAGSIRVGVTSVAARPEVDGVLLAACDQPRLDAQVVRQLMEAYDGRPGRIVASRYADTLGVPALFERSHFDELVRLEGDVGAKRVIAAAAERVEPVDWEGGALDLDTVEDLAPLDHDPD